jgi:hypothetical protein
MATAARALPFDARAEQERLLRNQNIARRSSASFAPNFTEQAANNNDAFQERTAAANNNDNFSVADTDEEEAFFSSADRENAYAENLYREKLAAKTYKDNFTLPLSFSSEAEEEVSQIQQNLEAEQQAIQNESRGAGVTQLNPFRQRLNRAFDESSSELSKVATEELKRQTGRWIAKFLGHGSVTVDTAAFGVDAFIFGILGFCYDCIRGVMTIAMPEEPKAADIEGPKDLPKFARNKLMYTLFPPYHPLREAGDFSYFLLELIIATVALTLIVTIICVIGYTLYFFGTALSAGTT